MGRRLNIGLDVDGVVSAFTPAARRLLKQLFNGRPVDDLVQTTWAFESLGITKEEENQMWRAIDTFPNWWLTHQPMLGTSRLPELCEKHRVVFITNRKDGLVGWPIEDQTRVWLKRNFGLWNANVIISADKGPLVRGLKLDYFLDDRPKNVEEVTAYAKRYPRVGTKTYIQDQTYNKECNIAPRVNSLNEFIQIVEGA